MSREEKSADEIEPNEAVLEQIITAIIQPKLRELELQRQTVCFVRFEVWVQSKIIRSILISSSATGLSGVDYNAQIRLRVRRTPKAHRYLWRVESKFHSVDLDGLTGFVGLGDIKEINGDVFVRLKNWVRHTNMPDWHKWK